MEIQVHGFPLSLQYSAHARALFKLWKSANFGAIQHIYVVVGAKTAPTLQLTAAFRSGGSRKPPIPQSKLVKGEMESATKQNINAQEI